MIQPIPPFLSINFVTEITYGPWERKFAWMPVKVMSGKTRWLTFVYCRINHIDYNRDSRFAHSTEQTQYVSSLFDILSMEDR